MLTLTEMRAQAARLERRHGWSRSYPNSPMVDEAFTVKAGVIAAVREFAQVAHPAARRAEQGEVGAMGEWLAYAVMLRDELCRIYDVPAPMLRHRGPTRGLSGASCYDGRAHAITLRGRLSTLTLLHELTHARGFGETQAVRWSVNVFRKACPRSWARLQGEGGNHVLRLVRDAG